ncbi:cholesteryl ester transfer protein [Electrophorus electricus]|uniref:Cholesteryl ester transfer protein n=1 Tax=Electrophorus electricus TaxID=8005 RepID=A0A4W4H7V9_ELEEL|nr:cholesteryl ester transfer protein [Electrophorus electricus]
MERNVEFVLALLLFCSPSGGDGSCLEPASAYRMTAAVCRLAYPAAVVLNEKTTEVIQAAFQHAKYPTIKGEKPILFTSMVKYALHDLEIYNLTIGKSEFEFRESEGVQITISNVSAFFKGNIQYTYLGYRLSMNQSIDFEVESKIDLLINSKLYCGNGRVAVDTSDCYLTFHKLRLLLQGDQESGWLKRLFTNFLTFTLKLVVKSQICKEINKVADILADFIQDTAEQFLSDGDIFVNINATTSPVITSSYIESYHKGVVTYNNSTSVINASVFSPDQMKEGRSLYFWLSDDLMKSLITAAYHDGRFICNISGTELTSLFQTEIFTPMPELLSKLLSSAEPFLRVWSVSQPLLWTTMQGTSVRVLAAVELSSSELDVSALGFEMEVEVLVRASYGEKKLSLTSAPIHISISKVSSSAGISEMEETLHAYLQEAAEKIGIPKVISNLEPELTALMDQHGLNRFDLINPEVVPQNGYILVQLDFGFPHHLLVDFLRKSVE